MKSVLKCLACCALLLSGAACNEQPGIDSALSRMTEQPKASPYGESRAFPDGRAMRPLPVGVVPLGRPLSTLEPLAPPQTTRLLLKRGRERFDIVCAACHGLLGDGDSVVADNVELRRPPSLLTPNIRAFTPARLFEIIDEGYGLMPSYRSHLSRDDVWAVVAYVRALQLAASVPIVALPAPLQAEARRALE